MSKIKTCKLTTESHDKHGKYTNTIVIKDDKKNIDFFKSICDYCKIINYELELKMSEEEATEEAIKMYGKLIELNSEIEYYDLEAVIEVVLGGTAKDTVLPRCCDRVTITMG